MSVFHNFQKEFEKTVVLFCKASQDEVHQVLWTLSEKWKHSASGKPRKSNLAEEVLSCGCQHVTIFSPQLMTKRKVESLKRKISELHSKWETTLNAAVVGNSTNPTGLAQQASYSSIRVSLMHKAQGTLSAFTPLNNSHLIDRTQPRQSHTFISPMLSCCHKTYATSVYLKML